MILRFHVQRFLVLSVKGSGVDEECYDVTMLLLKFSIYFAQWSQLVIDSDDS